MENNYQGMTKSSFWANLFKTPTEKSELEEVLLSMPPFKNLSNKKIKLLMKVIHNRIYAANEYVFFQDDPGIGLYIIIRGEILITQDTVGERFDLSLLTRGDFFGELALLDEEKRSASAIALKDSQVAVIFKPDLDEFVETHSKEGIQILRGISQIVATRLRNLNQDYFTLYNKTLSK
ncbi:MAG: cyclic nucleotide-binding domain-containing protein [Ignavibacteriales bacterium]|nr:MAG: cyclic nucleotide-binding domain-containing protein [Ignavibacteriales bacterium]